MNKSEFITVEDILSKYIGTWVWIANNERG